MYVYTLNIHVDVYESFQHRNGVIIGNMVLYI